MATRVGGPGRPVKSPEGVAAHEIVSARLTKAELEHFCRVLDEVNEERESVGEPKVNRSEFIKALAPLRGEAPTYVNLTGSELRMLRVMSSDDETTRWALARRLLVNALWEEARTRGLLAYDGDTERYVFLHGGGFERDRLMEGGAAMTPKSTSDAKVSKTSTSSRTPSRPRRKSGQPARMTQKRKG